MTLVLAAEAILAALTFSTATVKTKGPAIGGILATTTALVVVIVAQTVLLASWLLFARSNYVEKQKQLGGGTDIDITNESIPLAQPDVGEEGVEVIRTLVAVRVMVHQEDIIIYTQIFSVFG